MRPALPTSVLLLLTLLSGCTSPDAPPDPEPSPQATDDIHLLGNAASARLVYPVLSDGTATINLTNGYQPDGSESDAVSSCGRIGLAAVDPDGARQATHVGWFESRGHALVVSGPTGEGQSVEHSTAVDNYALTLDETRNVTLEVAAGGVLVIDMARGDADDARYAPQARVQAAPGTLGPATVEALPYHCVASWDAFEGNVVSTGLPPAPVTVTEEARHAFTADGPTRTHFLVLADPRFAGSCDVALLVDGTEVGTDASEEGFCEVVHEEGTGQIEAVVRPSALVAPVVSVEGYGTYGDRPS